MQVLYGAFELGLIYGIVAIAVYLTLRIVDFPDLTVNGSFTLGAAVYTVVANYTEYLAIGTLAAVLSGALAGSITSILNIKVKIQKLLAGIIVMIALYSINMRIMGKPNIALINTPNIYEFFKGNYYMEVFISLVASFLPLIILSLFFLSEIGLGLRASGQNASMAESYGVSANRTTFILVCLSNALAAFSGALIAQNQSFVDINMGQGIIIIGLSSVIIGERLLRVRYMPAVLFSCIIGAIVYQIFIALALNVDSLGLRSSDVYLLTALLIVAITLSKKTPIYN